MLFERPQDGDACYRSLLCWVRHAGAAEVPEKLAAEAD